MALGHFVHRGLEAGATRLVSGGFRLPVDTHRFPYSMNASRRPLLTDRCIQGRISRSTIPKAKDRKSQRT
jgi:hypothetical protein